jgi:diguanylate cyclase (GGDEF)-like protein
MMQDTSKAAHQPIGPMDDSSHSVASDVAGAALTMLHCSAVEVYLPDESAGGYTCAACHSLESTYALGPALPEEAIAAATASGEPFTNYDDTRSLEGPLGDEARRLHAASLTLVRCSRGQRTLGIVICAYEHARRVDAPAEHEAAAFARLASSTLDYARRANVALDRADRLATLLDSASAFAGELDLESLFAAIHAQVRRHMDAPTLIVALASGDSGQLRTEYVVESGVRLHVDALPPEGGFAHEVFSSGRPIVLESAHASQNGAHATLGANGRRAEAVLIVPMRLRDRIIGVMSVQSYRPRAFGAEHVQLLLEVAEQAATAIQNAGVFREERRRMAELAVLHRLAAMTNSEANLDRIMAAIVAEATTVFRADAASIALENERGDFTLAATHGLSQDYRQNRVISGAALRSLYGSPPTERFVGTDQLDSMGQADLVAAEGITNWFLVPLLLQQGRLIGSLALCGRDRVVRLSPSELRLAQLFADQAAAAMLRAQAAHALTERIEDYDLLTRVGRSLVSRLEVDYHAILQLLHEQLGYTHLAILTVEGDPPKLCLKAQLGHGERMATTTFDMDHGIIGPVAARGEMLYLPDVSRDTRYIASTVEAQSELAYPLKFGGQVLGVLDVQSAQRDAFTARDRRILTALADQCAIALSNARQYATAGTRLESLAAARAQLEQYAQYLERRQEELKLVNAVSAAASATLNLERILSSAVRSVADGLHADRCSVGILDEDQTRIEIAAEHRPDGHPTAVGVKMPLAGGSILTRIITERRTISTDDALADARFSDVRAEMREMKVRGAVVVPLIAGGRVIGTISINSSGEARHFTDDEIAVLETVANQLALGVRNARLYGRAKDRANEDSLTGLYNHRYLHERLEYELLRARRAKQPLAIALFDLNNFKMFNDTFGHQAGDEVLRVVAMTLGMCLRGTDIAGRYGGDEFLVILPQADAPGAQMLLNRVRRKLEEQAKAGFPPVPIELAAGIAVFPRDGQNKRELIAHADQTMYAEKRVRSESPAAGS